MEGRQFKEQLVRHSVCEHGDGANLCTLFVLKSQGMDAGVFRSWYVAIVPALYPKLSCYSSDLFGVGSWIIIFAVGVLFGYSWRWIMLLPRRIPAWHRRLVQIYWAYISGPRSGRPRIEPKLIGEIRRLSIENPLWGAPRIHAELLKQGWHIAQSTVSRYMVPRTARSGPGWTTFIQNHANGIVAIDMMCVRTWNFKCLYALVVLELDRRTLLHVEVTDHPTALWLSYEIAIALPPKRRPRFLIRDNDGAYGTVFRQQLADMGIVDRPTRPHSPWQNGYVERLIGTIRREWLNYVVVLNANHLRQMLHEFAEYYNNHRTHLSLGKDAPLHRPIERHGKLKSRKFLGGLHHRYYREPEK